MGRIEKIAQARSKQRDDSIISCEAVQVKTMGDGYTLVVAFIYCRPERPAECTAAENIEL
jgi:hypothetical protein